MSFVLLNGDCLENLKLLEDNSVDALVTDPPAGISFMGKEWDDDKGGRDKWVAWMTEVMTESMRVLKPGAHGLVWAIPRTSHWTATALENAGFDIRDVITHIFGTGFPKSLNVEKAGAGEAWRGFGTALKPASEHWVLVRKPCSEKTVAANVLKWGTGALNIDGCRIPGAIPRVPQPKLPGGDLLARATQYQGRNGEMSRAEGRFPANLILDEQAAAALDEQSGYLAPRGNVNPSSHKDEGMFGGGIERRNDGFARDHGGASRFFYVAKASKKDKGDDNTHPTVKSTELMRYLCRLVTPPKGIVLDPFMGSGSTGVAALKEGFKFIGIEKSEEYHSISQRRLEALDTKKESA